MWAVAGARVNLNGERLPVEGDTLPGVRIGGVPARVMFASPTTLGVQVPKGLDAGPAAVEVDGIVGDSLTLGVAAAVATDLHQVDNPVFDRDGNLYATFSGSRGERVPVSIFRISLSGVREAFVTGIVNATSMVFDADGALLVSSRFEGTVYRVAPDGTYEPFATDLGIACGLAFGPDRSLYVGDRSGTVFRIAPGGATRAFATLPASVAAFHLVMGPDGSLYATGPTLSPCDSIYRIGPDGRVSAFHEGFGRPQGLAFDARGRLHVAEALAGSSGIYRFGDDGTAECVMAGAGLVGVAIDPVHGIAVSSNDTLFRLPVRG
ncbi:MAG: gluconolaconase [Acidobacteria bacterium]|nr:gluconolaconase [Acidobacteriota bacterium]